MGHGEYPFLSPADQRARIMALCGFLVVLFEGDDVVFPKTSELFALERVDPDTKKQIVQPLQSSGPMWDSDLLGLRTLARSGRLKMFSSQGCHDCPSQSDRALG